MPKLEQEPRLRSVGADVIEWARRVAGAINPLVDAIGTIRPTATPISQAIDGPAVRAYLSADQALTPGALTSIVFNAVSFDTGQNAFNTSGGAWTPNVAGYYQINVTVTGNWSAPPATDFRVQLWKSSAVFSQGAIDVPALVSGFAARSFSDIVFMNGTSDFFQVLAVMNAASGTTKITGGATNTCFSGHLVRRA